MSDDTRPVPEASFGAVLESYYEAADAGRAPDAEALVERHPHLAPQIREFFAAEERFARAAGGLLPRRGDTVTVAPDPTVEILPAAGRSVGEYDLLTYVARGGMGEVYQARHRRLKRVVAVKLILAGRYARPADRERLRVEAQAAARLSHHGIAQLYELGEDDGQPFLAVEWCGGGSLAHKLGGRSVPASDAARMAVELAEAVQAAHDGRVLHRDLKPANVLLTADGRLKVADFGLAKQLDEEESLTQERAVLGSPPYMAPEQAAGLSHLVGTWTDVYGLGAILYEMLTGRPPFRGGTPAETMRQVLDDEVIPPRRLNRAVPRDLETICLRCLEKNPALRFATARDLADDLGRFRQGKPPHSRRVGVVGRFWRWCRRNPVPSAAAAVVLTTAAVAIALIARSRDEALDLAGEKSRLADEMARLAEDMSRMAASNATLAGEKDAQARLAEERAKEAKANAGEAVAQQHRAERRAREHAFDQALALLELGDRDKGMLALARVLDLPGPAGPPDALERAARANLAAWQRTVAAPQPYLQHPGVVARVAFADGGKRLLVLTDLPGRNGQGISLRGPVRTAVMSENYLHDLQHALTPLSPTHANSGRGRLYAWDLAANEAVPAGPPVGARTRAVSPDGTFALLETLTDPRRGPLTDVQLWNLATNQPVGPKYHGEAVKAAAFAADGKTVLLDLGHQGYGVRDTATGKLLAEGLRGFGFGDREDVAFSPDGRHFVTWPAPKPNGDGLGIGGFQPGRNPFDPQRFTNPGRLMPQPGRVTVYDARTGAPAGKPLTRLRVGPEGTAAVAPGGKVVLTSSSGIIGEGKAQLWDADTGQQIGADMPHPGYVFAAVFSPDAKLVLTHSVSGVVTAGREEVRLWDATTAKPLGPPLPFRGMIRAATFAPDGKILAVAGGGFDRGEVLLWDVAKGMPVGPSLPHRSLVTSLAFQPDGKRIASGSLDGTTRVWDVDRTRPIAAPARLDRALALTTDGTRAVALDDDRLRLRQAATGEPVGKGVPVDELPGGERGYELLSDGRTVLVWSGSEARLWDLIDGKPAGEPWPLSPMLKGRVVGFGFGAKGDVVAAAKEYSDFDGGHVAVWDRRSGARVVPKSGISRPAGSVAVSPDGGTVLVATSDYVMHWDVARNQFLSPDGTWSDDPVARFVLPVTGMRFCPDGRHVLVTGERSGSRENARLIDLTAGKVVGRFEHQGFIRGTLFSNDGELVLTAGDDRAVRVWSASTGKSAAAALSHRSPVTGVALSADKAVAATACADHTARVWDMATRKPLGPPLPHDRPVVQLAFTPDGRALLTRTEDGVVRTWPVPVAPGDPVDLLRLRTETLTGLELDENGGERGLEAGGWQERVDRLDALTRPQPGLEIGKELSAALTARDPLDRMWGLSHARRHPVRLEAGVGYRFEVKSPDFGLALRVEGPDRTVVAEGLDEGTRAAGVFFAPSAAAEYALVVTTPEAHKTGTYAVTLRKLEPAGGEDVIRGTLTPDPAKKGERPHVAHPIRVGEGECLHVSVASEGFDPVAVWADSGGKVLTAVGAEKGAVAHLCVTPRPGEYVIRVAADKPDGTGGYTLRVRRFK